MTACHAARLRCPVCGNPDWHDRGDAEECTHCGLTVEGPDGLAAARRGIPERLAAGDGVSCAPGRWRAGPGAWRNAAWRYGYVLSDGTARPAVARTHDVTLVVMTQPSEAEAAAALVADLAFPRTIVAVDAVDAAPWRAAFPTAQVIAHPLAGDFASQRNRLQAATGDGWVLQLDSDEQPDPPLLAALGWLTAAADADGLRSLGLPRRNLVDGAASALWPDIQYRLNRADVRFRGIVHERPVVPFAETSLALPGAIEHRLDRVRVVERTRRYAAMSADGARVEDEERLLRPFDPIADR